MKAKYKVWSDSESNLRPMGACYFENLLDAMQYASMWVHRYDGSYLRAILHVDDIELGETLDTVENILKTE